METLEKDDEFRKKLETANEADIRVCIANSLKIIIWNNYLVVFYRLVKLLMN